MPAKIKAGDEVVVISGDHKRERGKVLRVLSERNMVVVEGVNMIKRHQSAQKFREAGIIEREAPIHMSNVMIYDAKSDSRSRMRSGKDAEGKKVRIAAKSGSTLSG